MLACVKEEKEQQSASTIFVPQTRLGLLPISVEMEVSQQKYCLTKTTDHKFLSKPNLSPILKKRKNVLVKRTNK
jgi:hypothetical protein